MDPHQEMLDILHRMLAKLQSLPYDDAWDIGAFTVILVFVATIIVMIVIACFNGCIQKRKKQTKRVQPEACAPLVNKSLQP